MYQPHALAYIKEHNENFDYTELLRLESAKIMDLLASQELRPDCKDKPYVIRSMKWCLDLLDYMCERKEIPQKVNLCGKNDAHLNKKLLMIKEYPDCYDIFVCHYYRAKATRLYYLLRAFYTESWWY